MYGEDEVQDANCPVKDLGYSQRLSVLESLENFTLLQNITNDVEYVCITFLKSWLLQD